MLYLVIFLTFIACGIQGQDPEWNGDPNVCIPSSSPSSSDPPLPIFSKQAEFIMELMKIVNVNNVTTREGLILYEYFYNYDANGMIVIKNENGFIETDYYYYDILKKSTYVEQKFCVVTDIPTNLDDDGGSAIALTNDTWHIRPLEELLLFSSQNPQKPIIPKYIGSSVVRGIPVEQWEVCSVNKQENRTTRRLWSFAKSDFPMIMGIFPSNTAIPVEAIVTNSVVSAEGLQTFKFDDVYNILSYRPGIVTSEMFAPPKGVFCPGFLSDLLTLAYQGIEWPIRYNVRVDAMTSSGIEWNTFHLRFDSNQDTKRVRYDYMPTGANNYQTIIIDYNDQLRYTIDRELGSCKIEKGVQLPDVNPTSSPIQFFFKLKDSFIDQPPRDAWQFNGLRACRGSEIKCAIYIMSLNNYPSIVDPDTSMPTGQFWTSTSFEYAWSKRTPNAVLPPDKPVLFDYPVHLFMRMYRQLNISVPTDVQIEEVEYQFYEMSTEVSNNDFDTSLCYRSRDLPYLHLAFTLDLNNGTLVDSNHLDRNELEGRLLYRLQMAMTPISLKRINQIEIDHNIGSASNTLYVMFVLLGPTPPADPMKGEGAPITRSNDELSVETARDKLKATIDGGEFNIEMQLLDGDRSKVTFKAVANSLQSSRQFLSSHAFILNNTSPDMNVTTVTNTTVQNMTVVEKKYVTKWSTGAEIGGVFGGLIIGLVAGLLALVISRTVQKKRASNQPSFGNKLFFTKKQDDNVEMEPHG